jgi:hypothetical protein
MVDGQETPKEFKYDPDARGQFANEVPQVVAPTPEKAPDRSDIFAKASQVLETVGSTFPDDETGRPFKEALAFLAAESQKVAEGQPGRPDIPDALKRMWRGEPLEFRPPSDTSQPAAEAPAESIVSTPSEAPELAVQEVPPPQPAPVEAVASETPAVTTEPVLSPAAPESAAQPALESTAAPQSETEKEKPDWATLITQLQTKLEELRANPEGVSTYRRTLTEIFGSEAGGIDSKVNFENLKTRLLSGEAGVSAQVDAYVKPPTEAKFTTTPNLGMANEVIGKVVREINDANLSKGFIKAELVQADQSSKVQLKINFFQEKQETSPEETEQEARQHAVSEVVGALTKLLPNLDRNQAGTAQLIIETKANAFQALLDAAKRDGTDQVEVFSTKYPGQAPGELLDSILPAHSKAAAEAIVQAINNLNTGYITAVSEQVPGKAEGFSQVKLIFHPSRQEAATLNSQGTAA